jgi:uncharacterized membrane protein YidH (DUF202 family)
MFYKFVFGIGVLTIIISLLTIITGLCDFYRQPEAYKKNIDREPWLR